MINNSKLHRVETLSETLNLVALHLTDQEIINIAAILANAMNRMTQLQ